MKERGYFKCASRSRSSQFLSEILLFHYIMFLPKTVFLVGFWSVYVLFVDRECPVLKMVVLYEFLLKSCVTYYSFNFQVVFIQLSSSFYSTFRYFSFQFFHFLIFRYPSDYPLHCLGMRRASIAVLFVACIVIRCVISFKAYTVDSRIEGQSHQVL